MYLSVGAQLLVTNTLHILEQNLLTRGDHRAYSFGCRRVRRFAEPLHSLIEELIELVIAEAVQA
jgi:hypothetical protein